MGFKDKPSKSRWAPAAGLAFVGALTVLYVFRGVLTGSVSTTVTAPAAAVVTESRSLADAVPAATIVDEEPLAFYAPDDTAPAADEPEPAAPEPDSPLVETHFKCFQSAEYDEICAYDLLCFDGDKVTGRGEL